MSKKTKTKYMFFKLSETEKILVQVKFTKIIHTDGQTYWGIKTSSRNVRSGNADWGPNE